jgi:formylglycine-generating enzyme required for sulfatase activity
MMPRIALAVLFTILLTLLTECGGPAEEEIVRTEAEDVTKDAEEASAASAEPGGDMVLIPAGEFIMGSPDGEGYDDEHPQHAVFVDSFYLGKYEVTFEQYDLFCEQTGRSKPYDHGWGRGKRPVMNVSWDDAAAFCDWLSERSGERYRLPTEAEWEYACRAGTTTQFSFGDSARDLDFYAWHRGNAGRRTHPVGTLIANPWGLHDMYGNVWEWCSDWYGKSYYTSVPQRNPTGPPNGEYRVRRGGSWYYFAGSLRSADRDGATPDATFYALGFRCARDK